MYLTTTVYELGPAFEHRLKSPTGVNVSQVIETGGQLSFVGSQSPLPLPPPRSGS
jgi:hypothetical protein